MSSRRPTLLISNVLPERPGEALYNAHVDRMWASLVAAASPRWRIVREYAQQDGPGLAMLAACRADAVVLMGGEDLDPALYGGDDDYPEASSHWRRADAAHCAMVRTAVAGRIPLLGICRGMQAIGVALGGTLVQHIAGTTHHSRTLLDDHHFARHGVSVTAGSRLASALGEGPLTVHSAHHQAIDRVPGCLTVTALAGDGTVEAVEHREAPVLGVQWHPEDPESDPAMLSALLDLLSAGSRAVVPASSARPGSEERARAARGHPFVVAGEASVGRASQVVRRRIAGVDIHLAMRGDPSPWPCPPRPSRPPH